MFTQQCFIRKNSESLRNELLKLGYVNYRGVEIETFKYISTYFYNDKKISGDEPIYYFDGGTVANFMGDSIDCGTNEKLFFAIAALRDDSNKFQYFTNGVFLIKCSQIDLKHELDNNYEEFCVADFHKATVEELIEHFNK